MTGNPGIAMTAGGKVISPCRVIAQPAATGTRPNLPVASSDDEDD